MPTLQQLSDPAQSGAPAVVNENFESTAPAAMFGKRHAATSGLTWAFYGGLYGSTTIADGTVTLTASQTNYIVVERATGTVSTSTATTNWNNTTDYGRLYKITTGASTVSATEDHRFGDTGIFGRSSADTVAASEVTIADAGGYFTGTDVEAALQEIGADLAALTGSNVPAQRYTIELANTTDSDPGAGLVKFDNAAPASATNIYIDDSTSDGVDLSTFFGSLGATGFLKIQSVADAGEWVVFKWTSVTDGTGYWKFAVTVQASKGTLDDADAVLIEFDSDASSGGVSDGDKGDVVVSSSGAVWTIDADAITNTKLANMATQTIKGRTTSGTGDPEDLTAAQAAAILQGDGLTVDLAGFRGIPQNSQSAAYTLVAADAGKHIYHPSGDANARTFTIPANASVAFPVGTSVTFINETSQVVTIAITTDTLVLAGTGTTGSRSLAQYGVATAVKVTSTRWYISGTGLT